MMFALPVTIAMWTESRAAIKGAATWLTDCFAATLNSL